MSFVFKTARREGVNIILGLSGGTGSGKTFSALRIASGIAGNKPFALIDTENKRALHYADQFKFDHGSLDAPFTPDRYVAAIQAASDAKYPVAVVDSASHIWAGDGGVLDWHEAELDRMAKNDYKKREACNMAAWVNPKMSHKRFVQKLLQVDMHIILCFRAEPKVEMVKDKKGKTIIVPKESPAGLNGWLPVCEKNLPFELTTSFLLLAENPGFPNPIKLQEQHKSIFKNGLLDESCGKRIAEWAKGEKPEPEEPKSEVDIELIRKQGEIKDKVMQLCKNDKKAAIAKLQTLANDTKIDATFKIDSIKLAENILSSINKEYDFEVD